MKLIKESILNKIQLTAEVNGVLSNFNLVVVTKTSRDDANPVYAIYACQGEMIGEELHEFGDHDRDTREEEGHQ